MHFHYVFHVVQSGTYPIKWMALGTRTFSTKKNIKKVGWNLELTS